MSVLLTRVNKKNIKADKSKSKRFIVNACSLDERESKSVHISIQTSEVRYAINETKFEEPSIPDNPVINTPRYFKLFGCGKNFLNKLDATYEQA